MSNEVSEDERSEYEGEKSQPDNAMKKKRKKGIVYLSTIPPFMNVTKIIELMSQFGKVGRVFLQPSISKKGPSKKKRPAAHFTEGWVEFLRKRVAKEVAANLNNQQISTQKKSRYFDHMWNIKYLPRFKWIHLSERLQYERAVYKQRMRVEISQAKREASHFAQNVEQSERLAKKKVKNKPGNVMLHYKQRKTNDEILESKTQAKEEDRTEFLTSLFG